MEVQWWALANWGVAIGACLAPRQTSGSAQLGGEIFKLTLACQFE